MMRKRAGTVALLVLGAAPVVAQERVDVATIARIKEEALQRSQVLSTFNTLTNVIGPRLTGSPAYKTSADWARAQLERWGLSNAHLEPFEFGRGWSLEKFVLELTAPRYFPLFGYPEAWTPSSKAVLEKQPIYVGDKTIDEVSALGEQVRGAIVLVQPPQGEFIRADRAQPTATEERVRIGAPPSVRNEGKAPTRDLMAVLERLGAGAVLRPNMGEHGTVFVLGRRTTPDSAVPTIVLMPEHYNLIVRLTRSGTPVSLRLELRTRYHDQDRNSYNVIAELPGTDPRLKDEVVMLGAHLDSWHASTGATDNADGVASAMEAMRILKAIGAQPRRTIRLALWGGEEQGLLGSRAYVERHLAGPSNAGQRAKFYAYFNDDPGSGPIYGWYLEENAGLQPIFDAWLKPLEDTGTRRNVIDRIGSTDHLSFTALGLPGFTAVKDYVDYDVRTHHTNVDFYERVRESDLKQSAIVLATFAYQAATREARLPARPAAPAGQ